MLRIGEIEVRQVTELVRPLAPARSFFPAMTEEMLLECKSRLNPIDFTADGRVVMSFHSFVVRTARQVILVDTCCGDGKHRPTRPEFSGMVTGFLEALRRARISPQEVDVVLCTHLHWDHVGWNTRMQDGSWVPTFPNATYITSRAEFEHWERQVAIEPDSNHAHAYRDSVLPVVRRGQARLVDDTFELDTGIWLEPCPGHTPGNVVVNIQAAGVRAVFTGDVVHHRCQLLFPALATSADDDPELATESRVRLIERLVSHQQLMLPAHFPGVSMGHLQPLSRGGFGFVPAVGASDNEGNFAL